MALNDGRPTGVRHHPDGRGALRGVRAKLRGPSSGFETFFARCAAEFGGTDMRTVVGIGAEHGIHFVGDGGGQEPQP